MKIANTLRWIARIWGTAILAFLSIILAGSLVGEGLGLDGLRNVVNFLAFAGRYRTLGTCQN